MTARCLFHKFMAILGFSLGAPCSSVASGAGLEPGAPRRRALAQDLRNGHLVLRADLHQGLRTLGGQLRIKILALVIDHNKGWEVFHLNAPDGLHAQLWVLKDLDLLNAMLRQTRRRATN